MADTQIPRLNGVIKALEAGQIAFAPFSATERGAAQAINSAPYDGIVLENEHSPYDIKNIHRRLQDFTDDELKGIPVLPAGTRLEQGATYIDLRDPEPKEFTARADMVAGPSNYYVPKTEVDYQLWNRLIGVDNPERLGEAGD